MSRSGDVGEGVTGVADVSMPSAEGASAVDREVASGARGNSGSSRDIHVREADNPAQGSINRKRDKEIAERIIAEGTMNSECFTPATIDRSRCLGRVWGGGRGDQCRSKPCGQESYCASHLRELSHGSVEGRIPPVKLRAFIQNWSRLAVRAAAEAQMGEMEVMQRASRRNQRNCAV